MKILIIKLGAAGDVVRTTTLLHLFKNDYVERAVKSISLEEVMPTLNHIL